MSFVGYYREGNCIIERGTVFQRRYINLAPRIYRPLVERSTTGDKNIAAIESNVID